jgi:hypothetical protein
MRAGTLSGDGVVFVRAHTAPGFCATIRFMPQRVQSEPTLALGLQRSAIFMRKRHGVRKYVD